MTTLSAKLMTVIKPTHAVLTALGFCGGFFFCLSVVSTEDNSFTDFCPGFIP